MLGNKNSVFNKSNQPPKPINPLIKRIDKLHEAYDPASPNCRFVAVVFDAKPEGTKSGVAASSASPLAKSNPELYQYAQSINPDPEKFIENQIVGFDGIANRMKSQMEVKAKLEEKIADLRGKAADLSKQFKIITDQIQEIVNNNHKIQYDLISILQKTEVNALQNIPLSYEEQVLLGDLQKQKEEIDKPNQFVAELNTLSLKAKQKKDSKEIPMRFDIEPEIMSKAETVLKIDQDAISSLIEMLKEMEKKLKEIEKEQENLN